MQLRITDKIKALSQSGPSVRYQVIRLLVYIGESCDDDCHGSLFTDNDCSEPTGDLSLLVGYAGENVILETSDPPFVKYASNSCS